MELNRSLDQKAEQAVKIVEAARGALDGAEMKVSVKMASSIFSIGNDCLSLVLLQLPVRDILSFSETCWRAHGETRKQSLWRKLVARDFDVECGGDEPMQVYKEEHGCTRRHTNCDCQEFGPGCFDSSIFRGSLGDVKALIRRNKNVLDKRDNLVWLAATTGHFAIVEFFLKTCKLDPSLQRNTAIEWVARRGYLDILELLLEDPRVKPSDQQNRALLAAAICGRSKIVKRLLEDERITMDGWDRVVKATEHVRNSKITEMLRAHKKIKL